MTNDPTADYPAEFTVERARWLAAELVRELAGVHGDPEAVSGVMSDWCDRHGPTRFGMICMAATHATWTEHLVRLPGGETPPADGLVWERWPA